MQYTAAQQQAITTTDCHLQVIACAGSGKTQVISARVVALLKQGARPDSIVAFTFTNRAAGELKDRIHRLCREELGTERGLAELYVGTIHGYCLHLLQSPPLYRFLEYTVLNVIRQRLLIDRYSAQSGLTRVPLLSGQGTLRRYSDDTRLYQELLSILEEGDVDRDLVPPAVLAAADQYHELCERKRYLDYTTIMARALDQLRTHAALQEQITAQVRYLVVDEYQDVNPLQERIIAEIVRLGANLCVVGDDDQVLYQWRGSDVSNMLDFATRYPDVVQITLNENFRSSHSIVATARQVIERNQQRLPKAMVSVGTQPHESGDIAALGLKTVEAEATWIANTIRTLYGTAYCDQPGGPARGLTYSDCAVLLRSVRHDAAPILNALATAGVPCVVGGTAGLFETPEAIAMRTAFRFLAGAAQEGGDPLPLSAVQAALLDAGLGLDRRQLGAGAKLLEARRTLIQAGYRDPALVLQRVYLELLTALGVREEAIDRVAHVGGRGLPGTHRGEVAFYNLGQFSQVIADFEHIYFDEAPAERYRAFAQFLVYQAPEYYAEGREDAEGLAPDAVQVMTVHQAKGLQWPAVFVPALRRNRFPAAKVGGRTVWHVLPAAAVHNAARYQGGIEDERRLFYVALTRAEKHLHCTWAPHPTSGQQAKVSRFYEEAAASEHVAHGEVRDARRANADPRPRRGARAIEASFSDLKSYFDCPYCFKLRYRYGFEPPLSVGIGYGRALHNALAEIHAEALRGYLLSEADVPRLVDDHLYLPFAPPETVTQQRVRARRVLTRYLRKYGRSLAQLEHAEKSIELDLEGGLVLRGRIDLIRRLDRGQVVIVDFKSGNRLPDEEITEHQLRVYAAGYRELTGQMADRIEVHELERGDVRRLPLSERLVRETLATVEQAGQALRANELPRLAHWGTTCQRCELHGVCRTEPRGIFGRWRR
jgi:DNA helicase II / ATP-dependent DNA helicase PcrA